MTSRGLQFPHEATHGLQSRPSFVHDADGP